MAYTKHFNKTYTKWYDYPDESTPALASTFENYDETLQAVENQLVSLKNVATSGDYSDLSGVPQLKTVATTGSYNDLSDKLQGDGTTIKITNGKISAIGGGASTQMDTKDCTVAFSMVDDGTTKQSYTEFDALISAEKHSSLFNKISAMARNIRYLEQFKASKKTYGESNINLGRKANTTVGQKSVVIGQDCEATADSAIVIGKGLKGDSDSSITLGQYNDNIPGILSVGIGTSDNSRRDGLNLNSSGDLTLYGDVTVYGLLNTTSSPVSLGATARGLNELSTTVDTVSTTATYAKNKADIVDTRVETLEGRYVVNNSLEALNLTTSNTLVEVFAAMPQKSKLIVGLTSNALKTSTFGKEFPGSKNGLVEITKANSISGTVKFEVFNGYQVYYNGYYNGLTGWKTVALTNV